MTDLQPMIDNKADELTDDGESAQLRVQLAGCSVAALGGIEDPAKPGDYGWSASYQDVLDLRLKYEHALAKLNADIGS